jgi:transposase
MGYKKDYREQVLKTKEEKGLSIRGVADLFGLSATTVQSWMKRLLALKGQGRPRKLCLEALKSDVEAYPDGYQYERAKRLGVGQNCIFHGLKRLGISYKKKPYTPEIGRGKTYIIPKED